jgi:glycosyltransferase involved in cell wall biosynthesis
MSRPRVVYWNNIPSPYMVERFNMLAERDVVDFEAWFNERTHTDRSWRIDESSWRFASRYLPQRSSPVGPLSVPWSALRSVQPDVLISLFSEPSFILGWSQARLLRTKTAFRVLAPSTAWHGRSPVREHVKRYMFRHADALLVPGDDAARYARSYAPSATVLRESQVIDSAFFGREADAARPRRAALRGELGLAGTVFVYVGRLWWGKGVDHLLDAFEIAQRSVSASLLLVGDGEDEEKLRGTAAERGLDNVVFAGFRQREGLPALLAASDVFVMPTLGDPYGLVIDEAMASGLPIVSTSAAGEISDRVRDGETGYVVESADPEQMAARMVALAGDEPARLRQGENARRAMTGRTPELWAQDIEHVAEILASGGASR